MPKACEHPPVKQQLVLCQCEPRRKSHTTHLEDPCHLMRFKQQPSSDPYPWLQDSRNKHTADGLQPRRRGGAGATAKGLMGVVVRPHGPRSVQPFRTAFPRGRCGRPAAASGAMASVAAMAAWGRSGVWRRARQCGAGRPGLGPGPAAFPRGQSAVASNARGGAVPAGKSGYGAGMAGGEGLVELVPWDIPPSGRSRVSAAGLGTEAGPGVNSGFWAV